MYHPTTRVLAVLELLQSYRRMTGADLAKRLEVSVRTLRRYITMLQDLGIPIAAERGRYGAYKLIAGFKLPPMMFTNDEALMLAIGLLAAQRLGLTGTAHSIESTRAKLERVMPAELKERVQALTETILLDLPVSPTVSSSEIMITMSTGAKLQHQVRMHYRSLRDEETMRDFDPYGLALLQGNWYAVGYCGLRNDLRTFRLDRVVAAKLTDIPFERPPHFDALTYLVQKLATLPRRFPFKIMLKTDLIQAQSEIEDVLGVLEPNDEGILFRGSTDDLDWLARELAKFPFNFVVYEPEQLRNALRKRGTELANLAEAS